MIDGYFAAATSSYDSGVWYNWSMAFPQARFALLGPGNSIGPWMEADRILPTKQIIVIGIPGIPSDAALDWTFTHRHLTPSDIRNVLDRKGRDPLIFGASA